MQIKAEEGAFLQLQQNFAEQYQVVFDDNLAAKAIVVIPSLTLDPLILSKIDGIIHYEERLLCLLMLLRMPNTHIVYLTSTPIDSEIIDYYLHLLPGITGHHARKRLHFLSCYDTSTISLTEKILARPRLLKRIKDAIPTGYAAHLACFNVTNYERKLAVTLGLPVYGCNPNLLYWGTKSGSREIFKECDILLPDGFENLKDEPDIIKALTALYFADTTIQKAVVKMNDGFSGEGNAVFSYPHIYAEKNIEEQIKVQLHKKLKIVANDLSYAQFIKKFTRMGGIVEAFVHGDEIASPSVQCRINPLGKVDVISTHDQWLGGPDAQVFLGGSFPAHTDYAVEAANLGKKVAIALQQRGVLGRFSVDFLSVKKDGIWQHYAIEINLRKGGTTHPYLMLQFLTNGNYNIDTGKYFLPNGDQRHYLFTDNLQHNCFKGLSPADLIDIAICNNLHYDGTKEEGVMFHMIGALSQYGKLGVICIGSSHEKASLYYEKTLKVLLAECGNENK
ncbi:MAG: carboxylate-amine ligase [Chitinophagaceae bacterium]|nr:carboxylate-amine ligase [Chitinophagaceae bacterium]